MNHKLLCKKIYAIVEYNLTNKISMFYLKLEVLFELMRYVEDANSMGNFTRQFNSIDLQFIASQKLLVVRKKFSISQRLSILKEKFYFLYFVLNPFLISFILCLSNLNAADRFSTQKDKLTVTLI